MSNKIARIRIIIEIQEKKNVVNEENMIVTNKQITTETVDSEETAFFSELVIDHYERKVFLNKKEIILTNIEYNLLRYLISQPGRVFTYEQIYEAVWNEPYAREKGNIMTHIRHIREKIEPDPSRPRYIENVRGVGYRFKKE